MQTQLLPPSGRDFEVYQLVKFDKKPTRVAAQLMGISQTRVCQIVERVDDFLMEVLPDHQDDPRRGKRLNLAEQIAAERVDHLYGKSMEAFEASKGVRTILREKMLAGTITRKEAFGEQRFLDGACKAAVHGSKLPVSRLSSFVRWEEEDPTAAETVTVVEVRDAGREVVQLEPVSPPVEDCSNAVAETAVAPIAVASPEVASPLPPADCVLPLPGTIRPNNPNAEAVQEPTSDKKREALRRRMKFLAPLGSQ